MQGRESGQKALFGSVPLDSLLPSDHPLCKIRSDFDACFAILASAFQTSYGEVGNVSYPPAVLLRAWILKALFSIKSERALCEQIQFNAMFRWFVGLDWDDKVFDHSTLSRNRERLLNTDAAEALLGEVVRLAKSRRLLDSDRLVVDGTLIQAWASHKSFRPKDEDDDSTPGDFRGRKRSNKTHQSTTDPDAKLFRKGEGQASMLCHLGSVIIDSVSGLVRACKVSRVCGLGANAEVLSALAMAKEHLEPSTTLVADRGYDDSNFVRGCRLMGIHAHPRAKSRYSNLDGRTTSRASYKASMKSRYKVEAVFSWLKSPGRMRQTMLRGTEKVNSELHLYCIALNLRKMALR
jgi:transposase